jgi:hypothetical protein
MLRGTQIAILTLCITGRGFLFFFLLVGPPYLFIHDRSSDGGGGTWLLALCYVPIWNMSQAACATKHQFDPA